MKLKFLRSGRQAKRLLAATLLLITAMAAAAAFVAANTQPAQEGAGMGMLSAAGMPKEPLTHGEEFVLVISISDNPGFATMPIRLYVPDGLELTGLSAGGDCLAEGFMSPWSDGGDMPLAGYVFTGWFHRTANFTVADADLLVLDFRVADTAAVSTTGNITAAFKTLQLGAARPEMPSVIYGGGYPDAAIIFPGCYADEDGGNIWIIGSVDIRGYLRAIEHPEPVTIPGMIAPRLPLLLPPAARLDVGENVPRVWADIEWDKHDISSFDPLGTEEQIINGLVVLPLSVHNPSGIPLSTRFSVTVICGELDGGVADLLAKLAELIAYARALRASTLVSAGGGDVPAAYWWAAQRAHNSFIDAIIDAQSVLFSVTPIRYP